MEQLEQIEIKKISSTVQQQAKFQSSVKIIGYYPPLRKSNPQLYMQQLKFSPHSKSYLPNTNSINNKDLNRTISIKNFKQRLNISINPIKIVAQNNTLGIIDYNNNAWIFSQIFQHPINLSLLIKKKVEDIYLNEKQVILKTKKKMILINWGAKKLIDSSSLIKIAVNDAKTLYQNFFEAFCILDGDIQDIFYISNLKKSQNSNKMYRIMNGRMEIFGYPTLQKFNNFQAKIVGISVGKYHSLCWDQNGGIYSWGTRSLALGFKNLPDQDLVQQPTKLNFNFFVKTAFASSHYSLALSTQGKLYEWGIKKQVNQINEELIFGPKQFTFKYFKVENKKFTCLKGKNQKFGIICSSGQLYVWGQKTRNFINPCASIPKQWQNGRLYQPYLVDLPQDQKVIDFFLEQNYLSIITIPKNCVYHMKQQLQYWDTVKNNVVDKFNLKKYRKIKTQGDFRGTTTYNRFSAINFENKNKQNFEKFIALKRQQSQPTQRPSLFKQGLNLKNYLRTTRDDKISRAQYVNKSKEQYIEMAKTQDHLISHIMKPIHNQRITIMLQGTIPKRQYKKSNAMLATGLKFFKTSTSRDSFQHFISTNRISYDQEFQPHPSSFKIPDFLKQVDLQKIKAIKKKRRSVHKKIMNFTATGQFMKKHKDNLKPYSQRLQQVLQKKKILQSQTFNHTLKKLQENSLEFRMKRHLQIQMQKEKQNQKQVLKNTIQKFLIKNYLVNLIKTPLALARQIKIQNFARNLKYNRIQKNIRKIFIKAKVRFGMKKLKIYNFHRFVLLTLQWHRYVKHFRQQKYLQKRKLIVQQITKNFIKDKIKLGLSTSNLNIRKIQKFRQWLVLVKNQRMKCLKYLWRIHIFSVLKINSDNQNVIVCHLPKNVEEITFQSLYTQKIQQNPNLKLEVFLNKSPLFKIKVQYFRTVANLFTEQQKPLHKSQKIINYLSKSKKTRIKFLDAEQQQKQKQQAFKINILSNDILPYSFHYNAFSKPKNYDISISQLMKKNQKWIRQQKLTLQKILQNVIYNHQRTFLKKRRQYDNQLAVFIKNKYDLFCQKRWKYIIQYNQIEKNLNKVKKEKELLRIMDLIGMKRLLEQDCLPEKQAILDEALKRKDAPKLPDNFITFGQKQFKQAFKVYYDHINAKAKALRKFQGT